MSKEKITGNLSRLTLSQLGNLSENIMVAVDRNENDQVKTCEAVVELRAGTTLFKSALFKQSTTLQGKALAEADDKRDTIYMGLQRLLKGMMAFPGDKGIAATRLYRHFELMGPIVGMNYDEQTQAMDKVIADLSTPESKALFELLGFEDQMEELVQSQLAFKQLFTTKQDDESDLSKLPSATSLKVSQIALLRDFFAYLWIMRNRPPWDDIYSDIVQVMKSASYGMRTSSTSVEK